MSRHVGRERGTRAGLICLATLLGALACGRHEEAPLAGTPALPPPLSSAAVALVASCNGAEAARTSQLIPDGALVDPDARVRRAATRALARTLDGRASDGKETRQLEKGLSDEDPEVIAWAAYGLGVTCMSHEAETVRALVARAASLAGSRSSPPAPTGRFTLSPEGAIADALARCATLLAEQTLRAWLEGPRERGESAALSLARLAARRRYLDDATTVALLDAASRSMPLDGALAPFARLDALPAPVAQRLVEVAVRVLARGGAARPFAIRALGSAGAAASTPLADLLANARATPEERSLAATALGRLGPEGTAALSRALGTLMEGGSMADEHFLAANFAPLTATLAVLTPPVPGAATKALATLATLPIPEAAAPQLRRRLVALRCGAASILAGTASQSAHLVQCDPDPKGRTGALATLRVLDRGSLTAARFQVWKTYAASDDPAPRRAALVLVPKHPEMPPIVDLLVAALGAKEPGVVAEAARVLSASPARGSGLAPGDTPEDPKATLAPTRDIIEALAKALEAPRPPDQIETRVALARAASRLGVLSLKPRVERFCTSDNVTIRRAAEEAMRALGSQDAHCNAPKVAGPGAKPPLTAAAGPLTLTFVTDAGRLGLTLDPTLAPIAVSRVAELAESRFYDGLAIQRVSPGFLVQFGDPVGDGYGGSGKPPLPSETSPLELPLLSVGLAEGGRDTGSSQIFVTLSSEPTLYGDYPLLGWADREWATAAEGDVIRNVEVKR